MKQNQMLALNEDARDLLRAQASEQGLSVSNYVERLILEKEYEKKYKQDNNQNTEEAISQ